jgi:hypothetical protein
VKEKKFEEADIEFKKVREKKKKKKKKKKKWSPVIN